MSRGLPSGFLPVVKPPGVSSHDVVLFVRRLLGKASRRSLEAAGSVVGSAPFDQSPEKIRVGHAGTLDPAASGLLLLAVGGATRLIDLLPGEPKTYRAVVRFGLETDTDDAEGRPTVARPTEHLCAEAIALALARGLGPGQQTPPRYAAIQVGGERLYRRARRGEAFEPPPRAIHLFAASLLHWQPGARPLAWIEWQTSAGTYVRALARDLGRSLDSAAHLAFLVRTSIGDLALAAAHTLPEVAAAVLARRLPELFWPEAAALRAVPAMALDIRQASLVGHGQLPRDILGRLRTMAAVSGRARLVGPAGLTVAIVAGIPDQPRLERVIRQEGERA